MASHDRERIRQLMGEAAALPPEDTFRKEVETEVSAAGGWAEEEWLALLRFDEQTRLAVQGVRVPAQLEAELLTIPDSVPYRRRAGWGRILKQLAAAAFLVAFTAVAAVWLHRPSETDAGIHRVALLTMSEHFDGNGLTVKTTDPRKLERLLTSALPFSVVIPELGEGFELVGGRQCSLGSHAVAYSLWRSHDEVYSLYQFIPAEFDLTGAIERTTVPGNGASCQVVVWTEGGWGFAFVGSHE